MEIYRRIVCGPILLERDALEALLEACDDDEITEGAERGMPSAAVTATGAGTVEGAAKVEKFVIEEGGSLAVDGISSNLEARRDEMAAGAEAKLGSVALREAKTEVEEVG